MKGKRKARVSYGVPWGVFVRAWETSPDVDSVLAVLAQYAADNGLPPMTRTAVLFRASGYRKRGAMLKRHIGGRKLGPGNSVEELNQLIEQIRRG